MVKLKLLLKDKESVDALDFEYDLEARPTPAWLGYFAIKIDRQARNENLDIPIPDILRGAMEMLKLGAIEYNMAIIQRAWREYKRKQLEDRIEKKINHIVI